MAPRMAAVVWNAPVLLMFLFICSVFNNSTIIILFCFTTDKLLDIRQHTPDNLFFSDFVYSDALLMFYKYWENVGCFGRKSPIPS